MVRVWRSGSIRTMRVVHRKGYRALKAENPPNMMIGSIPRPLSWKKQRWRSGESALAFTLPTEICTKTFTKEFSKLT